MASIRSGLGIGCLGLALACGGAPAQERGAALVAACAASPWTTALPQGLPALDLAPQAAGRGPQVELTAAGPRVNDQDLGWGELEARLVESASLERDLAAASGDVSHLRVLAPSAAPVEQLARVVRAGHAAGLAQVDFVVMSSRPVPPPTYPDPAYAAELKRKLASADPSAAPVVLAEELAGAVRLCPGAQEVFAALAVVAPDHRCELLAAGLAEALPSCPLTDADHVWTAAQLAAAPEGPTTGVLSLRLDASAAPVVVAAGATWGELAPTLTGRDALWFAEPAPGEPAPVAP